MNNKTHIGWIPCLNGNLDFALINPNLHGSFTRDSLIDKSRTNVGFSYDSKHIRHHAKRVMMQSKIDWKDSETEHTDGDFRIFVAAEVNKSSNLDERYLKGCFYMCRLGTENDRKKESKDGTLPHLTLIHEAKEILEADEESLLQRAHSEETLNSLNNIYEKLHTSLIENEDFLRIPFHIDTSGLAYLEEPSNQDLDEQEKYVFTRQAFYYLKFSLHEHKHHHGDVDSLTTITQFDCVSRDKASPSDFSLRLLGQLKRELVQIKRSYTSDRSQATSEVQGVIAYMNSLLETLKYKKYLSDDIYKREKEYLLSINTSFRIQKEKIVEKNEILDRTTNKNRIFTTWSFSLVALISIILSNTHLDKITNEASKVNLTQFVSIILTIFILTIIVFHVLARKEVKKKTDLHFNLHWVKKVYKIEDRKYKQERSKKIGALILLFIFILSLSLVINLLSIYLVQIRS